MKISHTALCAICNNWKKQFGDIVIKGGKYAKTGGYIAPVWRTTKREIIERGYDYISLSDPRAPKFGGQIRQPELNDIEDHVPF